MSLCASDKDKFATCFDDLCVVATLVSALRVARRWKRRSSMAPLRSPHCSLATVAAGAWPYSRKEARSTLKWLEKKIGMH